MNKTNSFIFNNLRNLFLSKITRDTSIVLLGNVLSSGFAVIFTILVARSLGPEGLGIVMAVGSLITILVAFVDLGISSGLFRFVSGKWTGGDIDEANRVIRVSFFIRLASAFMFAGVLVVLAKPLTQLLLASSDSRLVILTALGMVGALLIDFHISLIEAKREWKKAAIFISATNTLRVLLVLLFLFLNKLDFISVLLIFTVSPFIASLVAFAFEKTKIGLVKDWRMIAREIMVFSGIMGANKIVSSINSRIDVILLVNLLGAYEAGIYAAANRLAIGVPIILGSFATVLAPQFGAAFQREDSLRFFKRAMSLSVFISIGLLFGIVIAPYVTSLFGPEFERSEKVLQLLFASFIPAALAVPAVNLVIYGLKKPQIITLLSLLQLPIILFVNFYFMPKIQVFAPVLALAIVNTTTMLVTFIVAIKYYKK